MQSRENRQHTILVVDDDPDILDFLHDLLEMEGYRVAGTKKANVLDLLQEKGLPDFILLDVFLSGKDGREIVAILKSREDTRHIPVLMFSAHPNAEATARAAGADDFLAKPFDVDHLLAKIRMRLSRND